MIRKNENSVNFKATFMCSYTKKSYDARIMWKYALAWVGVVLFIQCNQLERHNYGNSYVGWDAQM